MYIIIFILIALLLGTILFFIHKKINEIYENFVLENSIAIEELLNINKKYNFLVCNNYNESHTYDNQIFYNNISCEDYLIYQLQYKKNYVLRDINNIQLNNLAYDLYSKEVDLINSFGEFKISIGKLSVKKLLSYENKLFNKNILNPELEFYITINLYCSKINGEIYRSKKSIFNSEQILQLINKLNNKNGNFYNDRSVWDAICRVERGKVSNKMRFSIYERDGYRCQICGRSSRFTDLEIDHIKPIAKGGKTTYDNLQTLCKRCNQEKGDTY